MANKTIIGDVNAIEDLASFCRSRGFVFPGSEIYGGLAGFWDYGPLGVEVKNKIKQNWWKYFVQNREDVVGIDGAIVTKEDIWKASGHTDSFVDVAVICKKCKNKTKIDKCEVDKVTCDKCGGEYQNLGEFNPMFSTQVGPVKEDSVKAYLRPETCQTIFVNFKNVVDSTRVKLPFGIAQIGKAFRNEIAPRDFLFRSREFEQMELEFFADDVDDCKDFAKVAKNKLEVLTAGAKNIKTITVEELFKKKLVKSKWHAYWIYQHYNWFLELGIKKESLRLREHSKDELSHYSQATFDVEYNFPFGWKELGGNADRKDFDLTQHAKFSKKDLSIFDQETNKKIVPKTVSEPSQGVDRAFLAILADAYTLEKERIVLKLSHNLAPIQVAVFPLMKKDKLPQKARKVYEIVKSKFITNYDEAGSIGKRYRRMDEVGTPFCITVDHDTLKNDTVTVRERDSMKQKRIKINKLLAHLCSAF